MPGLGGLAGLSGAYSGYNQGTADEATARAKKYAIDIQQAGDAAFGRTLMMLNSGQQGGQPQPGQPPMQPPGGAPPMPPPGQPVGPMGPQTAQQSGPVPTPGPQRPPMPVQPGGGQPPAMPQQPMGGAPAQPPPMPGGAGPSGQPGPAGMQGQPALDWRVVFQKVQQANPDAPPQVLAAAVDRFLPLMNQQAQMQWREVSQQLRAMQIQQGEERVQGAQANLGERQREFDIREKRLESSAAVRQDQGWQRLEIQKQQLERQITEGKNKQLLGQWRAVLDAQHKRAMEIIQASSGFSALDPKDKKSLLDEQNKAYTEAIERMRNQMGSSTGTGGTSDMPAPKTQEAAPKGPTVPGREEKTIDGKTYYKQDGQWYEAQ